MSLSRVLIAGHTLISIVAIIVGVFALKDLFRAQASSTSLTAFIAFAIATTATGFILPLNGISPAVVISIMALIILAAVLLSRGRLKGSRWARWVYVGGLVASEYLLIFVGVVQAFTKVPPLKVLASTQSEPPFAIAQRVVLVAFVVVGVLALRASRPQGRASRASASPSFQRLLTSSGYRA